MTVTETSFEIQVRDLDDEDDWLTIDYVHPEDAVNVPVRQKMLAEVSYRYVRDARLVKIETHEDVLDGVPFKKETN